MECNNGVVGVLLGRIVRQQTPLSTQRRQVNSRGVDGRPSPPFPFAEKALPSALLALPSPPNNHVVEQNRRQQSSAGTANSHGWQEVALQNDFVGEANLVLMSSCNAAGHQKE